MKYGAYHGSWNHFASQHGHREKESDLSTLQPANPELILSSGGLPRPVTSSGLTVPLAHHLSFRVASSSPASRYRGLGSDMEPVERKGR